MRSITRALVPLAFIATITAPAAVFAPAAVADGKAAMGCSDPYTLGTIADIAAFSQPLVDAGYFTEDSLMNLLTSLDHNSDGLLCYKTPSGWYGPPATNGAHRATGVSTKSSGFAAV